ncbi:MAG TPA: hypothetical protein VGO53_05400, partial [Steroidobacteraceae bacterium]|nr:hypothetical protein [Steroidobacteraceae bacterium]
MSPAEPRVLRKRLMGEPDASAAGEPSHLNEIELGEHATIHFSSEDPAHPIEHMLDGSSGKGATRWASARPNVTEEILLEFDEPQHIVHVAYEV